MEAEIRFKEEDIKDLPSGAISRKYKCSTQYVGQILRGQRGKRSYIADRIRKDATKILEILKGE